MVSFVFLSNGGADPIKSGFIFRDTEENTTTANGTNTSAPINLSQFQLNTFLMQSDKMQAHA